MKSVEDRLADIWEEFERIRSEFPESVLKDLPHDLSSNHDHYLYGIAKKNNEWQPIETAPKDGTELLLTRSVEGEDIPPVYVGYYNDEESLWKMSCGSMTCKGVSYILQPQYWMPLPEPPKED